MKLQELTPMLYTDHLQETVAFYTTVLDFQRDGLNEEAGWASVKRDNVTIMFALPNAHLPFTKPTFTGSLYLNADNVDAWWQQLKDKVEVCYPIEDFDYGMREFAVYDNNGYLLQFGQDISTR